MLPAALAVCRVHRAVWWGAAGAVLVIVPAVAAARVYKGAHWATDVTASLLWGSL